MIARMSASHTATFRKSISGFRIVYTLDGELDWKMTDENSNRIEDSMQTLLTNVKGHIEICSSSMI